MINYCTTYRAWYLISYVFIILYFNVTDKVSLKRSLKSFYEKLNERERRK